MCYHNGSISFVLGWYCEENFTTDFEVCYIFCYKLCSLLSVFSQRRNMECFGICTSNDMRNCDLWFDFGFKENKIRFSVIKAWFLKAESKSPLFKQFSGIVSRRWLVTARRSRDFSTVILSNHKTLRGCKKTKFIKTLKYK